MKTPPRFPTLLAALAILCYLVNALSADTYELFTYTDDGTTITITDYSTTATGAVVIPAKIPPDTGKLVVSIGDSAFFVCRKLTSVTIPDSVTSIGNHAFMGCSGLTSVTIPDSVTSIGDYAFSECSGLTSVTIPSGVTSIGAYAFRSCIGLTSVKVPSGVTSIKDYAFLECSGLTSVTIPSAVTSIGAYAFLSCNKLTSISVNTANQNYSSENGVLFDKLKTSLILYPAGKAGPYTIPSGVTSIGHDAFYGCIGLTSVTIPDSMTSIGESAFSGCIGLTSITIPDSVTSIGSDAFYGCIALKNPAKKIEIDPQMHSENAQKNPADKIESYRKGAEKGWLSAQILLGDCYDRGKGVPQDFTEAAKWFRKAADQGEPTAQYALGLYYSMGQGVPKDAAEAVKWFRKAADQEVAKAQLLLGLCYAEAQGVPKDSVEAVKWLRKAAAQGLAAAQYKLGNCYYEGRGVPKDAAEAVKWYRKAADQGDAIAQHDLGLCYVIGQGVPKDSVEAVKWFRKAADQGDADAQYNLGVSCNKGEGVPKDEVHAYKWILLAAGQGQADAKKNMGMLEKQLTREEIAEGQKLARNFKPRKAPDAGAPVSGKEGAEAIPSVTGTGFFITDDGFLITNRHVIEGATQVRLATSAGLIAAKVVKVDAANDFALLKAEGKFAALPVATSRAVKLGASVATVGFPNIGMQGYAPKLAKGEIAALSGAADDARYFQISVPLQPGNSGGALVDERGNVVGVVSAKLNAVAALAASGALPENVNYAVKSSFLLGFLESVPTVVSELKEPNTQEEKFENVVQSVERAAVLVLNTSNKPTAGNSPPQAPTEAPSTVSDAPPAPSQPQLERKKPEPAAALPEIPEKLAAALIGAFLRHGEGNDMQLELADYAGVVNPYFDQGRMTRQGIAKDLSAYRAQWRDRSFQLLQVESASKDDADTLEAIYRLQFRASDGKKSRAGILRQSIHYTRAGDRWLVSGIQTIERLSK